MIIGFDASRAFTDQKTGTENYSYQILKYLAQIDHKNQYYIYHRPNLASQVDGLRGYVPSGTWRGWPANFKFVAIHNHLLWTQIGLALHTFIDPLDILFVPSHTLPIIRKPNLKTLITVHDLGSEYLPKMHKFKQRLYLKFMTHYQLKSATGIIAVSQATKKDLVKKVGINPEKITVIYEGIDDKQFTKAPLSNQKKILSPYNLKPNTYFLFIGTLQPRKNLDKLIQAFAQYLKISKASLLHSQNVSSTQDKLVLIGNKGWLSDKIYTLPQKLGIEDRVIFLGYIKDTHLPLLYSGAKALLFPSLFEGFGLPLLEAMACGCPVLTSNISSMPEVVGNGAILVDPYSVDSIAKGIKEITKPQTRAKLIKEGFAQIKKFSWEKSAKETLTLFKSD